MEFERQRQPPPPDTHAGVRLSARERWPRSGARTTSLSPRGGGSGQLLLEMGERLAYAHRLRRLRRLSKDVSRKMKGSHNRRKAIRRLWRHQARMANLRREVLHKLTTEIVRRAASIGIEALTDVFNGGCSAPSRSWASTSSGGSPSTCSPVRSPTCAWTTSTGARDHRGAHPEEPSRRLAAAALCRGAGVGRLSGRGVPGNRRAPRVRPASGSATRQAHIEHRLLGGRGPRAAPGDGRHAARRRLRLPAHRDQPHGAEGRQPQGGRWRARPSQPRHHAIYAKLDLPTLHEVALAWPGGAPMTPPSFDRLVLFFSLAGSSPRGRGTPVDGAHRGHSHRFIPARAGNTLLARY